jgi:hypothetical protein
LICVVAEDYLKNAPPKAITISGYGRLARFPLSGGEDIPVGL